MGVIINRGSSDYGGSSYSSYRPSPASSELEAAQAVAGVGLVGVVVFVCWAGPVAIWAAVSSAFASFAGAIGLPAPLSERVQHGVEVPVFKLGVVVAEDRACERQLLVDCGR